jgi:2,4-dienoyl-CoA reductase-like NADH-dependent reductase (Old Yellow Enzyme family)/thioredoxin reductase
VNRDSTQAYPHLFSPLRINGAELKNRIVRTAHGTNYPNRFVNERLIAYHEARARGGIALTILEPASVHASSPGRLIVHDDGAIAAYRVLMERLAPHGMRIFQQLWHGGAHSPSGDGPAWSSSAVPSVEIGSVPRPMTKAMIDTIIEGFASAARRCQEGGLDGVEIHAGHGYLLSQFLSPVTNRREDEYGGPLENRMRLLSEVLRAVKGAVGPDFPVGVRLSSTEWVQGGLDVEDTTRIATNLAEEGLIDFLDLSLGSFYSSHKIVGAMHEPHCYQLPHSEQVSRRMDIPTIVAGRITNLEEAEHIVSTGMADLVSMVRTTIADPDLVVKTLAGRESEIRPCIACNQGCIGGIYGPRHRLGCTVNVDVGNEYRSQSRTQTQAPRRVLVVGAGPAGMEAARVAATRGHDVVVHEAQPFVGGQTTFARRAPHRWDFGRFCDWQRDELERLGVPVYLNSLVDAEFIAAFHPDDLIVATGATPERTGVQRHRPHRPVIGVDLPHVFTVVDVLSDLLIRYNNVLVFDDLGTYPAIAAAEYLLERGKKVTLATTRPDLAGELGIYFQRVPTTERLFAYPEFRTITHTELEEVGRDAITLRSLDTGSVLHEQPDAVVIVCGFISTPVLADSVGGSYESLYIVGDAAAPRDLGAAIADGDRVGHSI